MKTSIWLLAIGMVTLYCTTSCKKLQEKVAREGASKLATSAGALSMLSYNWGNVAIGGGGYVTGIAIHPTTSNRMYIRTDVGGAYRWDGTNQRWVPMLEQLTTIRVDGMALDANAPDRVYLALNDGVYRSDDRGGTWAKVFSTTFDGNGDLRWAGECLAVDSLTSTVVYAGTRTDGLYRSTNTGSSWTKIATVPAGTKGVRTVVTDPSTTVSGRSGIVYAGIPGTGIYRSTDGGTTFSALSGAPVSPNRMVVAGGKLYVAHTTGVTVWNGSAWTDITPAGGANKNYCGLAIEAYDYQKIAVCQRYSTFNNPLYRSSDGGVNWQQMNTGSLPITKTKQAPWWPNTWFSSATASLAFDPLHHGDLYYTDWFGVWYTSNAWAASSVAWETRIKGDEETVVLTLASPPGGVRLYSGVADVFGFRHDSITEYPTSGLYNINEGFSISYCESSPANIAILGSSGNDGTGTILATSTNNGATWTARTLPAGVKLGRICISSNDPDKMVYIAGGSTGTVYYTTDRGNSWSSATGAPTGAVNAIDVWSKDFSITADCVTPNKFYIYKTGYLYASTDGGATWAAQNATAIPNKASYLFVAARPGTANEVWVSLDGNGLYKTTNGGTTFSKVTALSTSTAFAWGAPPGGSTTPTVFSYGTLSGVKGMYRSTDLGATWDQIDNGTEVFPAGVKGLAGDRQVFGRVYVGTGGRGVLYGQP
ncbi:WD40/YVTN/BNR-like repeat-containing protein [Chitinophaga lutea]